jgi:hypothetical protein
VANMIDEHEQCQLVFESEQVGDWVYLLTGVGSAPTPLPEELLVNSVGEECTKIVRFRNPFRYVVSIAAELVGDSAFRLVRKKGDRVKVQAGEMLEVPYSYMPREPGTYHCNITLSLN